MSQAEEYLGADFMEHAVVHPIYNYPLAMDELRRSQPGVPHMPFDLSILRQPTVNRKTFDVFIIQQ